MNAFLVLPFQLRESKQPKNAFLPDRKIRNQLRSYIQLVVSVPLDTNFTELWLDYGHDGWDFILSIWVLASLPTALVTSPTILGIFNSSIRKNAEISYYLSVTTVFAGDKAIWTEGIISDLYGCWFFNILERIIPNFCFRLGIEVPFRSFYLSVFPRLHRTLESWTNQNSCHTGSRMLTFRNPDAYTALPVLLNYGSSCGSFLAYKYWPQLLTLKSASWWSRELLVKYQQVHRFKRLWSHTG